MAAEIHGTSDPCHVTRVTSDEVFSRVRIVPLLIAVCLVGVAASAQTSTYVFVPEQSQVVQTGGIASVHWTYTIRGQFQLAVDPNAGSASFGRVDANATDDSPFKRTLDPDHVFNMTSLVGVVVGDTTIKFTGKAPDDSDVSITVTLQDNLAHLVGQTTPPPNSADFFIFSLDAVAQRKYGGGTGEPNDPYQIATPENLMLLGETPADYDKHFIMTDDIDLDPNLLGRNVFDRAVIAPDTDPNVNEYSYNGFDGPGFRGVFDGNRHTISHLTITGKDYLALFGQLASRAEVRNLAVVDVNITASGYYVGGLVGSNAGMITNCYSTGSVFGCSYIGGLVGDMRPDSILAHCCTGSSVSGGQESYNLGGLVGYNNYGEVDHCFASGSVCSGNRSESLGGLVGGYLRGAIRYCYAAGAVVGGDSNRRIGGLIGHVEAGAVTNCYATSSVSGGQYSQYLAGLVGYNDNYGTIDSCYAAGLVRGEDGSEDIGGLVGYFEGGHVGDKWYGSVTKCLWDVQKSGQTTSDGGTGKTTAEMQTAATFLDAGWDFVNVWGIGENQTYPYLRKYSAADINQDGSISFLDLALLAENWLGGFD